MSFVHPAENKGGTVNVRAVEEEEEEYDLGPELSVEFTMLSGETISVRHVLEGPVDEAAIQAYAADLISAMGTDAVRTFAYWWEDEYYVDAVRMHEVAALSVSTVADEDEDAEWEE